MKRSSVFFGTPEFALSSLRAAMEHTNLLAVISQPDRPRGRGQQLTPSEVKAYALKEGITVFSPPSLRKENDELTRFKTWMSQNSVPDFVLVTAYGNILPQNYLDWAKIGPINVHASLLPRWRGAAPIQRALEAGDVETGVCLQKMVYELDAGDVLAEERLPLDEEITAIELTTKLSQLGGKLLASYLGKFNGNSLVGVPQPSQLVTLAPKISKEDGFWKPSWSALETHNKVRAFAAWPGVKVLLNDQIVKLCKTSLVKEKSYLLKEFRAGMLTNLSDEIFLSTGDIRTSEHCYLKIEEIQFAGKAPMKACDALRNDFNKLKGAETLEFQSPTKSPIKD
jgi:methionyl-tRNA formyltransferase